MSSPFLTDIPFVLISLLHKTCPGYFQSIYIQIGCSVWLSRLFSTNIENNIFAKISLSWVGLTHRLSLLFLPTKHPEIIVMLLKIGQIHWLILGVFMVAIHLQMTLDGVFHFQDGVFGWFV